MARVIFTFLYILQRYFSTLSLFMHGTIKHFIYPTISTEYDEGDIYFTIIKNTGRSPMAPHFSLSENRNEKSRSHYTSGCVPLQHYTRRCVCLSSSCDTCPSLHDTWHRERQRLDTRRGKANIERFPLGSTQALEETSSLLLFSFLLVFVICLSDSQTHYMWVCVLIYWLVEWLRDGQIDE